ncbi:MAG: MoaD/ThiS family protein [Gemmatimonadales bacterium]
MSTAAAPLNVRVLLFASYADLLGREALQVTLPRPATIASLLERVRALPGGAALPPRPLCARNLAHVGIDAPLDDGDEVALLPPLAGG